MTLRYTNQKYEIYCRQHPMGSIVSRFTGYCPIGKEEILAFRGLQFIAGASFCNKQALADLYDLKALPHFRAAISRDRLLLIFKVCRFDDLSTRDQRTNDKFGHIREMWDKFAKRCRELYGLCVNGPIDEMLLKFRGRCKFRQYMPSKPGRYGIKFWILSDFENHYCYNAIPYLGKEGDAPTTNLGAQVVQKLVETIRGSGRNITCDRYFTGVELFEQLYQDKLTAVGTVMPNRKQLPVQLLPNNGKRRDIGSSIFAFKDRLTISTYFDCQLFTTMITLKMKNPEMINFYNETKSEVDALDQKVRHFKT